MEILVAIIAIVWSILGIILFFKIWGMTNNVKEMHDLLKKDIFNKQRLYDQTHSVTPRSKTGCEELSKQAIQTKPFDRNLRKGDKVTIAEYGTCTFEGVWQGKYAFYPTDNTNLPESPYLINDAEPYLLIPQNKLGCLIV